MTVRDQFTDHEYDGIREYDNPCPGWWNLLFVATVVFSVIYFLYYQFNYSAPTLAERWQAAEAANTARQFASLGNLTPDEPTLNAYRSNAEWLPVGQQVFKANCVSCHGADGQGLVGPNLTDDYYKNVTKLTDIAEVVANGANNGAMPAWKNRLQPNEIVLVSAYVASLRGQDLPGPRVAGDHEIAPWPATAAPQPAATDAAPTDTAPTNVSPTGATPGVGAPAGAAPTMATGSADVH